MKFSLSDREADVMQVLWDSGPSTVTEVRAQLADVLAYTTVLTVLRKLEDKGFVAHEEEGRAHRYCALVGRDDAQRSAIETLKHKLFKGSPELLLMRLVAQEELTEAQIKRIQRLLDENRKKGGARE